MENKNYKIIGKGDVKEPNSRGFLAGALTALAEFRLNEHNSLSSDLALKIDQIIGTPLFTTIKKCVNTDLNTRFIEEFLVDDSKDISVKVSYVEINKDGIKARGYGFPTILRGRKGLTDYLTCYKGHPFTMLKDALKLIFSLGRYKTREMKIYEENVIKEGQAALDFLLQTYLQGEKEKW